MVTNETNFHTFVALIVKRTVPDVEFWRARREEITDVDKKQLKNDGQDYFANNVSNQRNLDQILWSEQRMLTLSVPWRDC